MKKSREKFFASILFILAIGFTIGLSEITLRIKHKKLKLINYVEENWNLVSWEFPIQHDSNLGWIPKVNSQVKSADSKTIMNLIDWGIRSNGGVFPGSTSKDSILAVGASHVFGSQVSDSDTWPAILEKESKFRVINGGVFAYGFDQVILRMEDLVSKIHPERIIIGVHPDNLSQTVMSQKYAKKPYFDISNNELVLKNTPVPITKKGLNPYQAVMGYSYLVHYLMTRLSPQVWLENHGEIKAHNKSHEVSCLLIKRADYFCRSHNIKCSLLFQYFHTTAPEAREQVIKLTPCIKNTEINLWDPYEALEEFKKNDLKRHETLFDFHMTPQGNAWMANYVLQKINHKNRLSSFELVQGD